MKSLKKIISLLTFAFLLVNLSFAQTYPKVKVTLKDGTTSVGKKGNITEESVSFMDGKVLKTYDLSEVTIIQAKKGTAGKWALGFGGGCLGLGLITTAVNPNDDDVGTLLAGSFIWAGAFAGIGALIGLATDNYENVYVNSRTSSLIKRFDLNLTSNQFTNYNISLSYKF